MSADEFSFNHGQPPHPEVAGGLDIQPAEQITLRHIMAELTNKTKDGTGTLQKFVTLIDPASETIKGSAYHIQPGTFEEDPGRVGEIKFRESGRNGMDLVTDYALHEIADGFSVTKHVRMDRSPNIGRAALSARVKKVSQRAGRYDGVSPPPTLNDKLDEARLRQYGQEAAEEIYIQMESRAVEDQLGLSFVAEAEARDLLARLTSLQPASS